MVYISHLDLMNLCRRSAVWLGGDTYEILRFAQDDRMGLRMTEWGSGDRRKGYIIDFVQKKG